MTPPHAQRLLVVLHEERRRRTAKYLRHRALLTSTRMCDAVNALLAAGIIRAMTQGGCPVHRYHENDSVLIELNEKGSNK